MSFSSDVKKELYDKVPSARHCQLAALAAIIACDGLVTGDDEGRMLLLLRSTGVTRRKFFTLLRKAFNINPVLAGQEDEEETAGRVYETVPLSTDECDKLLAATRGENVVKSDCCKRTFIREAFCCIGSVSDPGKSYHLEFTCEEEALASQLSGILKELGIEAHITHRARYFVVYIKESEAIGDVLLQMGASLSLMRMENERIVRGMRGDVNRRVNCEMANITKTVDAAARQLEDIRFLESHGGLGALPRELIEVAQARLDNPEASLAELGMLLDPPVGKSGVNHRLRRLCEMAGARRESHGTI